MAQPDPIALIAGMRQEIERVLNGNEKDRAKLEALLAPNKPLRKPRARHSLKPKVTPFLIKKGTQ